MREGKDLAGSSIAFFILSFCIIALISITGIGLILTLPLVVGAVTAYISRDTSAVSNTTLFSQILFVCICAFGFFSEILTPGELLGSPLGAGFGTESPSVGLMLSYVAAAVLMGTFLEFAWKRPLMDIIAHRASQLADENDRPLNTGPKIIQRDSLTTFSTADELLKWNRMLSEGIISQSEFDDAKRRLLDGN